MLRVFQDLCPVSPEQATLLGSPIGSEGVDKFISDQGIEDHGGQTTAHTCT